MAESQSANERVERALRFFTWGRIAWFVEALATGGAGTIVGFLLSEGAARARFEDRIGYVERVQRETVDGLRRLRDVDLDGVRSDAHKEVQQLRQNELKNTNDALNASLVTVGRIEGKLDSVTEDLREIKSVLLRRKR